eukprot:SM000088S23753  [mRNA]  locus=s88:483697:489033:+ [translate_table: standard]
MEAPSMNGGGGSPSTAPATPRTPADVDEKNVTGVRHNLLKACLRSGTGTDSPKLGNQVVVHSVTRTIEGKVIESTRKEHGGSGVPLKVILGKSKLMKAWEQGILTMVLGEIAVLRLSQEQHYGDPSCPVPAPESAPVDQELLFEIEVLAFYTVKVVCEDLSVVKQVLQEGKGFELPREPSEVKIRLLLQIEKQTTTSMLQEERAIIQVERQRLQVSTWLTDLPDEITCVYFEVELLQIIQVRDMLGDGAVIKRRLRQGQGEFPVDCPLEDSTVLLHYKGTLPDDDGRTFLDTRKTGSGDPLEIGTGEGLLPEGLDMSVRLMLPGELALVTSNSGHAYDSFARGASRLEGAMGSRVVELHSSQSTAHSILQQWDGLSFEEIMSDTEALKAVANDVFRRDCIALARLKYEKLLRELGNVHPHDDQEKNLLQTARESLQLNIAACFHRLQEFARAIEVANKVLEGSPFHGKALYRRGNAYMSQGDYDEAREDFLLMAKADANLETEAKAALARLKRREQDEASKQRKQFKGLFDKKPGMLSEEPLQMPAAASTQEIPRSKSTIASIASVLHHIDDFVKAKMRVCTIL